MKNRIRELRAQRARLAEQANGILTAAGERNLNSEEASQFDKLHRDITDLGQQVERLERQEAITAELAVSQAEPRAAAVPLPAVASQRTPSKRETRSAPPLPLTFASVSGAWTKRRAPSSPATRQAARAERQTTQTGSTGGYLIPITLLPAFEQALRTYGGMFEVSTPYPTDSGEEVKHPTGDNTTQVGEIVAENTEESRGRT
jgi:HK97 family phage major capsid protein